MRSERLASESQSGFPYMQVSRSLLWETSKAHLRRCHRRKTISYFSAVPKSFFRTAVRLSGKVLGSLSGSERVIL